MTRFSYTIPARVRRGALRVLARYGVTAQNVVENLETSIGFETRAELGEALQDLLGGEAGAEFDRRFQDAINKGPLLKQFDREASDRLAAKFPDETLLAVPDHVFNEALDQGRMEAVGNAAYNGDPEQAGERTSGDINDLFARNGVPYGFGEDGRLVATGSATVAALAVQPAIDVLDDPRLAEARGHLFEAQRRLQEHDDDEVVDEARFAVEHGMLALLDATGTDKPDKRQPNDLFDALAPPGDEERWVIPRAAQELVLAAPRLRGRTTAGHAGGERLTRGDAEAAIAAAAAALLLLAHYLPEP